MIRTNRETSSQKTASGQSPSAAKKRSVRASSDFRLGHQKHGPGTHMLWPKRAGSKCVSNNGPSSPNGGSSPVTTTFQRSSSLACSPSRNGICATRCGRSINTSCVPRTSRRSQRSTSYADICRTALCAMSTSFPANAFNFSISAGGNTRLESKKTSKGASRMSSSVDDNGDFARSDK